MMAIEPRYSDWLGTKRDCAVGYGSREGSLFNNQHSIDTDDVTMDAEIVNKPIWCCPGICPVQQPDNTMSDMFAQRQSSSYLLPCRTFIAAEISGRCCRQIRIILVMWPKDDISVVCVGR